MVNIKKPIEKVVRAIVDILMLLTMLIAFLLFVLPYARLEKTMRQPQKKKPRILWGKTPIINIKYGSNAARLYGYHSDTIVYAVSHINQSRDFDFVLSNYFKPEGLLKKAIFWLIAPYAVFLWAIMRYDVFHFYFDGGFFTYYMLGNWLEVQLLHLAGKKVIVVPYGGDARLESLTLKHKYNFCMDCTPETKTCNERFVRRAVNYYCKHGDIVLGCADLVDTLPRFDGIWQYPTDMSEWPFVGCRWSGSTIKIVHASNHRKYKGTRFLIRAVEELKNEGYDIELILVERMLNQEAKRIYQQADIIADQFIGGAYAQFAIEGMSLGKPVMCYLRQDLYKLHPEWTECPIVNTNPDNLKEQLVKLINNPQLREELGRRGVEYVKKYHDLNAIGANLDRYYKSLWHQQ